MFKTTLSKIFIIGFFSVLSSSAFAASCKKSWYEKVPIIFMCECSNTKTRTACEEEATAKLREVNRGCDDVEVNRIDMHVSRLRKFPRVARLRCVKAFGQIKAESLPPLTPAGLASPAPAALPSASTSIQPAPQPCKPGSCAQDSSPRTGHDVVPDSQISPDRP